MGDKVRTDFKTKDSFEINFDALPLEGFAEGRRHVQAAFNADYARMTRSEQVAIEGLLTKKRLSRPEIQTLRTFFQKYGTF